jgi:hypothetical protein
LLLAGCVTSSPTSSTSNIFASAGPASSPRPLAIVVTAFVVSSDVVVIDRSFTARLERKIGAFPTHERKQRTLERVNDEIVATIVASLREAGLEAQPGSEEGLSLSDNAVVVSGRLRPNDPAAAKKHEVGIGNGRGGVVAEMTLSSFSTFGKKQLLSFAAEAAGGRKGTAPASAKATAASNAAIAQALAGEKSAVEKLSPDVEAAARRIGRATAENILGYAKTQGWLNKPADAEPAADDKDEETQVAKKPAARPEKKPAA